MYASYEFYHSHYYNNILTEVDFNRLATRASDYIDRITNFKAAGYAESAPAAKRDVLAKCCCELAEQYQEIEGAQSFARSSEGNLQSESVGSYSRSFRSGAERIAEENARLYGIAEMYLAHTGLLYRGVGCCVHTAHCDYI